MELGTVAQRKDNGKLYMVTGKVGKHHVELREVTAISIQLHVDSKSISTVYHHSDFEPCKKINIDVAGRQLPAIDKSAN